jgi:hypothetical protein
VAPLDQHQCSMILSVYSAPAVHSIKASQQRLTHCIDASLPATAAAAVLCNVCSPNRAVSPGAVQVGEVDLTLPCDAAGTVRLSMISVASAGSNKQYKQLSATVPVNPLASCPASPCHSGKHMRSPDP